MLEHHKKTTLAFVATFLALTMLSIPLVTTASSADPPAPPPMIIDSGTTGTLTWELDDTGTLTISGVGPMPDYATGTSAPPWKNYRESIVHVVLDDTVTCIGDYAFYHGTNWTYQSLIDVYAPGIERIGEHAFDMSSVEFISIPSYTEMKDRYGGPAFYTFRDATNLTTLIVTASDGNSSALLGFEIATAPQTPTTMIIDTSDIVDLTLTPPDPYKTLILTASATGTVGGLLYAVDAMTELIGNDRSDLTYEPQTVNSLPAWVATQGLITTLFVVEGTITDADTSEPLSDVIVYYTVNSILPQTAITDTYGEYTITASEGSEIEIIDVALQDFNLTTDLLGPYFMDQNFVGQDYEMEAAAAVTDPENEENGHNLIMLAMLIVGFLLLAFIAFVAYKYAGAAVAVIVGVVTIALLWITKVI